MTCTAGVKAVHLFSPGHARVEQCVITSVCRSALSWARFWEHLSGCIPNLGCPLLQFMWMSPVGVVPQVRYLFEHAFAMRLKPVTIRVYAWTGQTSTCALHQQSVTVIDCWLPASIRSPATVYPLASAIDTPLPAPKKRKHYMLKHKPAWVQVQLHSLG